MPKILTQKDHAAHAPSPSSSAPSRPPHVLKRNQVCFSTLCSDANKPCSTCVRSHAHAVAHPQADVVLPDHPECTYDEIPGTATTPEPPKNRYEKLENRINELESMLREQSSSSPSAEVDVLSLSNGTGSSSSSSLAGTRYFLPSPQINSPSSGLSVPYAPKAPDASTLTLVDVESVGNDLFWPGWPRDLPPPNLSRHLIEAFFTYHPHATRMFHVPTFMASLSLSPSHPRFPTIALLHAICAVGSLYTTYIKPTPNLSHNMAPNEVFSERYRAHDHVESFAEQHIRMAKHTSEEGLLHGHELIQNLQAQLIITWWYWCNAKYAYTRGRTMQSDLISPQVFMTAGRVMRCCLPLGLNVHSSFSPLVDAVRPPTLIAPPEDLIEEETRRNTFWLAYCIERMSGCGNSWAVSLDDQDITQLLPRDTTDIGLRRFYSDTNGQGPSGGGRQYAMSDNLLTNHPEGHVDGFGLYVKGAILLSKVKAFNLRFRSMVFAGDPSVTYLPSYRDMWEGSNTVGDEAAICTDPRRTAAFIGLDRIASSFRQSFPSHLKNPIPDGVVDSHLYTASLIPHLALIMLHDPHAHIERPTCISAFKLLESARAILDLIYAVRSSSYDITLLDFFCPVSLSIIDHNNRDLKQLQKTGGENLVTQAETA
ncbi:hypothetical protein OF83DRAFT_1100041 [Amylostereum chailletii]|nr:hypothetical protein OF83DRAFT_1100041 [Amylostereum chailletii]